MTKLYEVGGCVRDELLGLQSKDVDFAVETQSFEQMTEWLEDRQFHIFQSVPYFLTIRAQVPEGSALFKRTRVADFVMCRKDSPGSDGRRPDFVEPGTIFDDLARRDFTVNAIARDTDTNQLLDPHGGRIDLEARILRFVGDPMKRITEDGLRVLRGLRFMIMKHLEPVGSTKEVLHSHEAAMMLSLVSIERVREELTRMFRFDAEGTFWLMAEFPKLVPAIFRDGLWLEPTLKGTR